MHICHVCCCTRHQCCITVAAESATLRCEALSALHGVARNYIAALASGWDAISHAVELNVKAERLAGSGSAPALPSNAHALPCCSQCLVRCTVRVLLAVGSQTGEAFLWLLAVGSQSGHVCLCMPCLGQLNSCMAECQSSTQRLSIAAGCVKGKQRFSQAGCLLPHRIKITCYPMWLLAATSC